MEIVFMGSPDFAIPSLEKLYHSDHTIKAVVSNVDKRRGRGSKKHPTPLKARAQQLNLPTIDVDDLSSGTFTNQLKELEADLFVVVAFRILPPAVLDIPKIGSINLHASLLPKYRGAAPIHWAVMNGESETGCTVFFLDEKIDTGNIILQRKISIGENETTGDVYERLKNEGSELLLKAVNAIEADNFKLSQQDDDLATPAPKLFRDDCHIDFENPAIAVHNKIRGLSPFPTAWAKWEDKKFNMYQSKLGPALNLKAGRLCSKKGRLLVGCSEGTVELLKVQLPGTRKMSGMDFIRGYTVDGELK
ncbi:MAG: methionyl-tRNA formyltransferase [Balneolaceae bacterium]|nr:methionyl-tRNA formyltransferase [Balneolaceae bacterium]